MNLTTEFQATDAAVMKVTWNRFGVERIFDTKLRDEKPLFVIFSILHKESISHMNFYIDFD